MLTRDKAALRKKIKQKLSLLPEIVFSEAGTKAAELLYQSSLWNKADSILLFLSMHYEIETFTLIQQAFSDKKAVYIPRTEENKLSFYRIDSMDGPWHQGPFGIREPLAQEESLWHYTTASMVICPGLAFDRSGARLGRGKGYYDRFLAEAPGKLYRVGFCLGEQVLDALPMDEHDIRVQYIANDTELIDCTRHS